MTKRNKATPEVVVEVPEVELTVGQAMAKQLREARGRYETTAGLPGKGASADCADEVAMALRGATPDQVCRAAEVLLGLGEGELAVKYAKLNPGQIRMNAGNRIRGFIKREGATVEEVRAALAS